MYAFDYQRAETVAQAASLLKGNEDAKLLGGGQTLIPTLKQRLNQPSVLVDISRIAELKGITEAPDALSIGAVTRHAEVAESAVVRRAIPALAHLAGMIGDGQVRNMGTLGGSIANNDPAADYPAALVGLGATVHTDQRSLTADDFFTGMFETALAPDELVVRVAFPRPKRAAYAKFRNPASRYAIVGVFVADFWGKVRVAVTGAAPGVFRLPELETALSKEFSPAAVTGLSLDPETLNHDIHASREYRAHLVTVMAKRAVAAAAA